MSRKCETPHKCGASRNSFAGPFRDSYNPIALQSQFPSAHHVQIEPAVMAKRPLLDLGAIRRAYLLPSIVGTSVKLQRAGNEWKGCCPFHLDRSPSFYIFSDGERFHCFGCGASGDVLDYVQRVQGVGLVEAAELLSSGQLPSRLLQTGRSVCENRSGEALAIWKSASLAAGSLAESYLASRGIILSLPPAIRFSQLPYGRSGPLPCLVAAVQDIKGAVVGIQRTYLASDGRTKAKMPKPKLSLGRVSGCAIRLGNADSGGTITVCEGLEDGLTLAQELGRPVWVAAGASMLPSMQFPAGVHSIVIGADNDEAGALAANKAANAFMMRGLAVRIIRPLDGYKDFNAELMGAHS